MSVNGIHVAKAFAILDAARIFGEMETAQSLQNNFLSLYMGKKEELLSAVAPYLFEYHEKSEFATWLHEKGWGNSWGIFVTSSLSLEELRMHFRKFLLVKTEDDKELYFRFYDPRVLRIFLPTCDQEQLNDFFGPITSFEMEAEDPAFAVRFELKGGKLIAGQRTKEQFWNSLDGKFEVVDAPAVLQESPAENNQDTKRKWNFFIE